MKMNALVKVQTTLNSSKLHFIQCLKTFVLFCKKMQPISEVHLDNEFGNQRLFQYINLAILITHFINILTLHIFMAFSVDVMDVRLLA